jgi:hypothetical protein
VTQTSEDSTLAWNQLLTFEIEPAQIKDLPTMNVTVDLMDKAMIGSDTRLGCCSFSLSDFTLGEDVKDIVSTPSLKSNAQSRDLDTAGTATFKVKIEKRTR